MRRLLVALCVMVASPARADEAQEIMAKLRDPDLVVKTYGAIAVEHFVRARWHQPLFDQPRLHPWQLALDGAAPLLVEMLAEDRGLEWIDESGNPEKTTTPRRHATVALLALERASIEPLIVALDRRPLAHKSDVVLRRIVKGGPAGSDRQSWTAWWSARAGQALPNERGRWWLVLIAVLAIAVAAALAWLYQRRPAPSSLLRARAGATS
jgi:hypothetical protein